MSIDFTNVNDVPIFVNHNVAIVPVLDLQQIANDGIGGHGFDEITASQLKFFGCFITIRMQKVFVQSRIGLTAKLISGFCIRNAFDYTTLQKYQMKMSFQSKW